MAIFRFPKIAQEEFFIGKEISWSSPRLATIILWASGHKSGPRSWHWTGKFLFQRTFEQRVATGNQKCFLGTDFETIGYWDKQFSFLQLASLQFRIQTNRFQNFSKKLTKKPYYEILKTVNSLNPSSPNHYLWNMLNVEGEFSMVLPYKTVQRLSLRVFPENCEH